jgi:hypothetical protein
MCISLCSKAIERYMNPNNVYDQFAKGGDMSDTALNKLTNVLKSSEDNLMDTKPSRQAKVSIPARS